MILPSNLDATLPVVCNTPVADVLENVRYSSALPIPWLRRGQVHDFPAVLVGGGPSVLPFLKSIEEIQQDGGLVFSMNGTRALLHDAGIFPDYFVLADAQPDVARYVGPAATSLISAQCDRAVFDAEPHGPVLWHPSFPGVSDIPAPIERLLIGGGSSVGLLAMSLAYVLGCRDMHLFGYDSSYDGPASHAYEHDSEPTETYTVGGRAFRAAPWMARQAVEFQALATQLADLGVTITVHGAGLLPAVAALMAVPTKH